MAAASSMPAFDPSALQPAPLRPAAEPLDGDRIDFGCWLLPPAERGMAEQIVQAASWIAGPTTTLIAGVGAIAFLF